MIRPATAKDLADLVRDLTLAPIPNGVNWNLPHLRCLCGSDQFSFSPGAFGNVSRCGQCSQSVILTATRAYVNFVWDDGIGQSQTVIQSTNATAPHPWAQWQPPATQHFTLVKVRAPLPPGAKEATLMDLKKAAPGDLTHRCGGRGVVGFRSGYWSCMSCGEKSLVSDYKYDADVALDFYIPAPVIPKAPPKPVLPVLAWVEEGGKRFCALRPASEVEAKKYERVKV